MNETPDYINKVVVDTYEKIIVIIRENTSEFKTADVKWLVTSRIINLLFCGWYQPSINDVKSEVEKVKDE